MERKKVNIEKKANIIRDKLSGKDVFTVSDAESVLGGKRSTIYWTLWNLSRNGYIYKVGNGLYSLEKKEGTVEPILSHLAHSILDILEEGGHQFFISGLDILSVFMEHVPETYPVLLFADKYGIDDVYDLLSRNNIDVIIQEKRRGYAEIRDIPSIRELTLLYPTNEFAYSEKGLASLEKAFVDLYYEVTRSNYPLSVQELVRIYVNMKRRTSLNTNRLIKVASRRNIHYDIRYIVDHDYITKNAREFATILKKQER
ncbi:hypothetical protein ES708_07402 [subsurface metagenome]